MFKPKTLAACAVLVLAAACGTVTRGGTTFEPVKVEAGVGYYRYLVYGDAGLPKPTPETEGDRLKVLEEWLQLNGLGERYEVVERNVVFRMRTTFGVDVHDTYYVVRVPR